MNLALQVFFGLLISSVSTSGPRILFKGTPSKESFRVEILITLQENEISHACAKVVHTKFSEFSINYIFSLKKKLS